MVNISFNLCMLDSFSQIRFMSNDSHQPAAGSGAGKVSHLSSYYLILAVFMTKHNYGFHNFWLVRSITNTLREIQSLYSRHTFFTDGSKQNNHTASALVQKSKTITKQLPNSASIYTAKFYVILYRSKKLASFKIKLEYLAVYGCASMAAFRQLSTHGQKFDPESLYAPM